MPCLKPMTMLSSTLFLLGPCTYLDHLLDTLILDLSLPITAYHTLTLRTHPLLLLPPHRKAIQLCHGLGIRGLSIRDLGICLASNIFFFDSLLLDMAISQMGVHLGHGLEAEPTLFVRAPAELFVGKRLKDFRGFRGL